MNCWHPWHPAGMSAREALRMAVQGGARNLGRDDIGQIAPGFAADLAAWRTDTLGFSGAASMDPVAGLVLCANGVGHADVVLINGRVVVRGGQLQTVDVAELVAAHSAASARICSHYSKEAIGGGQ